MRRTYRWGAGLLCAALIPTLFALGSPSSILAAVMELPASLFPREQEKPVERLTMEIALPPIEDVAPTSGESGVSVSNAEPGESDQADAAVPSASQLTEKNVVVSQGDSLYVIFKRLGLPQAELLLLTEGEGRALKRLHPGQRLVFHLDPESMHVERLVFHVDDINSIHFGFIGDAYEATPVAEPYEVRQATAYGRIDDSLFLSGQRAGLSDKIIMEMVEIFAWDVDFALDIRSGDGFSVVYEELFKEGEKVRDGKILAAEFVNRDRTLRALRYTDPLGNVSYFTPDGDNMRKSFLRTPVKFTRISSHFNLRRKHPILHTIRAHRGVDYAAPRGTPVKATGDGQVIFAGNNGGYGKTVIIRHAGTYTTLYAHLAKVAKGARVGRSVKQGDVVGVVGSTGLATGPHLHYEFRVRGVHRNPLTVELPKAAPIAAKFRKDFLAKVKGLDAKLDFVSRTQLAENEY